MAKSDKLKGEKQSRSAHMVRLPKDLFAAIQETARENDRTVTREVARRLIATLEPEGKWPRPGTST